MNSPSSPCKLLALIDETRCIGCSFCRVACPFDAIAGAPGYLYSVIKAYCTGCGLCLPPCPVDCIQLTENPSFHTSSHDERIDFARASKLRVRNLQQKGRQQNEQKQRQYHHLKQQAQNNAADRIKALKEKMSDSSRK